MGEHISTEAKLYPTKIIQNHSQKSRIYIDKILQTQNMREYINFTTTQLNKQYLSNTMEISKTARQITNTKHGEVIYIYHKKTRQAIYN